MLTNTTTRYWADPAEAEAVAADANANDNWTYVAVHDPKGTGYSYIKVYDEEGHYVGTMF
jgi:hypothetical protein